MSNNGLDDLPLPLDERNLAHVLSAVALAALVARGRGHLPGESTCWWCERAFMVRTGMSEAGLFDAARRFLQSMRWIPGFGAAEQGTFVADSEIGSNPFISLAEGGQEKSPFKTFSGQQGPGELLEGQKGSLASAAVGSGWLVQPKCGIASWGFDCRVGSHAYDLGFSSNDEGTGDRDPIYPAVEMLSIAGASFFAAVHGWQLDADSVGYSIWTEPISVTLARYAVADRLDGLPARRYHARSRGGAYGKGAAYRFFPEATLRNQKGEQ